MAQKKPPSGLIARSFNLLSMATQLAGRELSKKVGKQDSAQQTTTKVEQAKILVEHLSRLKGAAMKAGQMLSLDTSDFLPPEAVEILSQLQAQAEPVDTSVVLRVVKTELGEVLFSRLQAFSEKAIASASIGQVHTATLNGQKVVIKIQYPGVAESIDSDIAILKGLSQTFVSFAGKKIELTDTFVEVKDVLKKETDYLNEANNIKKYSELLKANSNYVLPQPIDDYCTSKVLTMTFTDGQPLRDWMLSNPSYEKRVRVAELVLELYCLEFAQNGFVQTDPNFGNFLVRDESANPNDLKLILLDFGATIEYSQEFRNGYAQLLSKLSSNDANIVFKSAVEFGLLDPRESDEVKKTFINMIQVSLEPFDNQKQPFEFTEPSFEKRTRQANIDFTKSLVYSPPPRQLLFLHRKLGGIFNLVKRLEVSLDLRPYWKKMTNLQ